MLLRRGPWFAEGASAASVVEEAREKAGGEGKAASKSGSGGSGGVGSGGNGGRRGVSAAGLSGAGGPGRGALLEGAYSSIGAAVSAAGAGAAAGGGAGKSSGTAVHTQSQQPQKPSQPKPSQPQATPTSEAGSASGVSQAEMETLAKAGIPFIEVYEAGYGPAAEKAKRRQRLGAAGATSEAGGIAAGGEAVEAVHREERKAAIRAVAKAEKEKEKLIREVNEKYREALKRIWEEYREGLRSIEEKYHELKSKGVEKVMVDTDGDGQPDTTMTLEQWRAWEYRRLQRWREEQLRKLREWKQEAIRKGLENIERALEEYQAVLSEWRMSALKAAEEYARALGRAREEYEKWLRSVEEQARHVASRSELEELAEQAYRSALSYWLNAGLSRSEAERLAEQARERVLKAGEHVVALAEQYRSQLKQLYEKYAEQASALSTYAGAAMFKGGLQAEAQRLLQKFLEDAMALARRLGLPEDVAQRILSGYREALQKTISRGLRYGEGFRQLEQLYEKYASQLASLVRRVASGDLRAVAALDRILAEFKREAESIASRYGLQKSDVEQFYRRLEEYAGKVREAGLKYNRAAERAEEITRSFINDFARNPVHHYMNVEFYARRLKEKIVQELTRMGIPREAAEKIAESKAAEYVNKVESWARARLATLQPADFLCERVGRGIYCEVYVNGRLVHSFTLPEYGTERGNRMFYGMLLDIGLKPARMYVAKSSEEFRNIKLAYLREKNPKEYMRLVGSKAFKWEGGISPKSIYRNVEEFLRYVQEFYQLPAEKLMEKAEKAGGAKGAALGALAGTALLGAGILSGAMQAWNIPGMVEFGRQLASGELVQAIKAKPTVMVPTLAGQLIGGAAAFGAGLKGLGSAAARMHPTLGTAVPQAVEAAALGALAYGAWQAKEHKPSAIPLIIGATFLARKGKGRTKVVLEEAAEKTVELPLEKAIKLIEEGKARPELEIAGRKYVYVRVRVGGEEQPALVPREVWEEALRGNIKPLEELLGRKVVLVRPGRIGEVYASLKPEEFEALWRGAKREYVRELEAREQALKEEIRRTIEEIRELTRHVRERPELREQLREAVEKLKLLRERLREISPEAYEELMRRMQARAEYRPEGIREFMEWAMRVKEQKPEYKVEFELPTGERFTLGEVLEMLTRPEEKPQPAELVALKPEQPKKPPIAVQEEVPPPQPLPPPPEEAQLVAVAAGFPGKPPRAVAVEVPPPGIGYQPSGEENIHIPPVATPKTWQTPRPIPPPPPPGEERTTPTITVPAPTPQQPRPVPPPPQPTVEETTKPKVPPPPEVQAVKPRQTPSPPPPQPPGGGGPTPPSPPPPPPPSGTPTPTPTPTPPPPTVTPTPTPSPPPTPQQAGGEGGRGGGLRIPLPMLPLLGEAGAPTRTARRAKAVSKGEKYIFA